VLGVPPIATDEFVPPPSPKGAPELIPVCAGSVTLVGVADDMSFTPAQPVTAPQTNTHGTLRPAFMTVLDHICQFVPLVRRRSALPDSSKPTRGERHGVPPDEGLPATHAIRCRKTLDVVTATPDGLTSCKAHIARNRGGRYGRVSRCAKGRRSATLRNRIRPGVVAEHRRRLFETS
jgi:hypothetical protein